MLQLTLQVSRMIVTGRDAVHQVVDKVSQLSAVNQLSVALRHASSKLHHAFWHDLQSSYLLSFPDPSL